MLDEFFAECAGVLGSVRVIGELLDAVRIKEDVDVVGLGMIQ